MLLQFREAMAIEFALISPDVKKRFDDTPQRVLLTGGPAVIPLIIQQFQDAFEVCCFSYLVRNSN